MGHWAWAKVIIDLIEKPVAPYNSKLPELIILRIYRFYILIGVIRWPWHPGPGPIPKLISCSYLIINKMDVKTFINKYNLKNKTKT